MLKSIFNLILAFSRKLRDDNVNALSAHAAFFILIAFFPFTMFLLTLLQYLPISLDTLFDLCKRVFPDSMEDFAVGIVQELSSKATGAILSVTVLAGLWSASRGILAMLRGLNYIYNYKETRNYFVIRILSTFYTLAFAIMLLLLGLIFVFGNRLTNWLLRLFPQVGDYALLVISVRTLIGFCILLLFFILLYLVLPNRKSNLFRELPGAILSAAGWIGFSFLFSFYIDNMGNYSATYGSLTAIVLSMLWLYACMYIFFLGAELNAALANPVISDAVRKLRATRKERRAQKKLTSNK